MIDFILFKIETNINFNKIKVLEKQMMPSRIQYDNILTEVSLSENKKNINIHIKGYMDKDRYSKKKYFPKEGDCNILKNLILFEKFGYNLFTYKRSLKFNDRVMKNIVIENYFNNIPIDNTIKENLANKIFVVTSIIHPVQKRSIDCKGKATSEIKKNN